jgi:RimJ/RimL family protein N-acetyltransferase
MLSIALIPLQEDDKLILFEWINNKTLVEFNSYFKPVTWHNHCQWFDAIQQRQDVKLFGIRQRQTNTLIGSCQLLNINTISQSAELQIRLGVFTEMGKGFGTETVALLLKQGFDELRLQRIYLHVFSDNVRAIKTYLKNGFKKEGLLQRAAFVNDSFKDITIMAILKEDYYQ